MIRTEHLVLVLSQLFVRLFKVLLNSRGIFLLH